MSTASWGQTAAWLVERLKRTAQGLEAVRVRQRGRDVARVAGAMLAVWLVASVAAWGIQ